VLTFCVRHTVMTLLDLTTILCEDIAIRQLRGCRLTQCTPHVRRLDDEMQ
jgi:hypothetical protein